MFMSSLRVTTRRPGKQQHCSRQVWHALSNITLFLSPSSRHLGWQAAYNQCVKFYSNFSTFPNNFPPLLCWPAGGIKNTNDTTNCCNNVARILFCFTFFIATHFFVCSLKEVTTGMMSFSGPARKI